MAAVHVLTLIVVFVAILVVAVWLMAVTYHLHQVSSRLNDILDAVNDVGEKTTVLDPVISEIASDLAAGHEAVEGAVARLKDRHDYQEPAAREPARRDGAGEGPPGSVPSGPPPFTFTNY